MEERVRFLLRYQWHVILAFFAIIAIVCFVRLWTLRWIFLSSGVRMQVEQTAKTAADEHGWLLSGISIKALSKERVELCYRDYLRGEDPRSCSTFDLAAP